MFQFITLILTCSLIISCNQQIASIESSDGPSINTEISLNNMVEISPNKFLVSSKDNGFFIYSKKEGWSKPSELKTISKVNILKDFSKYIIANTKDGSAYLIDKENLKILRTYPHKLNNLSDLVICDNEPIFLSTEGLFKYTDSELTKFKSENIFPLSADCNPKGDLLVGTRFSGLHMCNIKHKSCLKFFPETETSDIRAIKWNQRDETWYIGLYGNVSKSIIKLKDKKWENVGQYISDIKALYKDVNKNLKYILTETGKVYEFKDNNTIHHINSIWPITSSIIDTINQETYALSFNTIVMWEENSTKQQKNMGGPIDINDNDKNVWKSNTYIWDIEFINDKVILSATGQDGVWWSADSGYSWQKLGKNLKDPKIHFVKYSKKHNKIIAGTHTDGIYYCNLPCTNWTFLNNNKLNNSDPQDANFIDENNLLIATEKGAAILDVGNMNLLIFKPLKENTKNTVVADFLTAKVIDKNNLLLGIHTRYLAPDGVWNLNKTGNYKKLFAFPNEPVTGIEKYKGDYIISTLNGLYRCDKNYSCFSLLNSRINKITLVDEKLIFAGFEGVGLIKLNSNLSDIVWILKEPSHSIEFFPNNNKNFLVGTFEKGVIRVKLNN